MTIAHAIMNVSMEVKRGIDQLETICNRISHHLNRIDEVETVTRRECERVLCVKQRQRASYLLKRVFDAINTACEHVVHHRRQRAKPIYGFATLLCPHCHIFDRSDHIYGKVNTTTINTAHTGSTINCEELITVGVPSKKSQAGGLGYEITKHD
jgi:hypothetical protein